MARSAYYLTWQFARSPITTKGPEKTDCSEKLWAGIYFSAFFTGPRLRLHISDDEVTIGRGVKDSGVCYFIRDYVIQSRVSSSGPHRHEFAVHLQVLRYHDVISRQDKQRTVLML